MIHCKAHHWLIPSQSFGQVNGRRSIQFLRRGGETKEHELISEAVVPDNILQTILKTVSENNTKRSSILI